MSIQKFKSLFQSVQLLIDKEEQLKKAKGESFNIFSILKMESKENDTHSNLLGNLLDPNGSHLMGAVFLEEFLDLNNLKDFLDASTTRVYLEYSCGKVDCKAKTGGRIDIYLLDKNGRSISIENKVYAGDQPCQIERYVNHNKASNKVFYLSLDGKDASEDSRGDLRAGIDYFTISYRDDIINWLEKCSKEASNQPIVRETIKQYKILIQKLTKTMDTQHEQELQKMILSNYDAAELIARNFDSAKEGVCEKLRNIVFEEINKYLESSDYNALLGDPIAKNYSQIWIKNQRNQNAQVFFGLESFGTKSTENMFIGTFRYGDIGYIEQNNFAESDKYWCNRIYIEEFNNDIELNMSNGKFISILNKEDEFKKVVDHILKAFKKYFEENNEVLDSYLAGL